MNELKWLLMNIRKIDQPELVLLEREKKYKRSSVVGGEKYIRAGHLKKKRNREVTIVVFRKYEN